jgi:hypothetical protein
MTDRPQQEELEERVATFYRRWVCHFIKHQEPESIDVEIAQLLAFVQAERAAEARACAMVAKTFSKGYDIDWWMEQTKRDISKQMCLDVAEAIEQRIAEGGG